MAASSAGRVVMLDFIEKYKNSECLWKITDKHYKNKQHRQKALEELLTILKKIDSTANVDSVTKKINSLRSAFNKEHNKDMDMNTDQASPLSPRHEQPPRLVNTNLKRKEKNGVCEVLSKISKRLDSTSTKTKPTFSAFGEHVAEKLRTMNSDAAKYCQKIINDAIFYAEFNKLNYTSRIVTDHMHLDRSRSPSAQSQSPYLKSPSRLSSTQTSSLYYRTLQSSSTQSPYQSPNQQLDRPYRSPSTQTQSPYQSPNEQLDRSYRPPSTQTQSPYQSPSQQLDRPYRSPSTQTQSPYQSPNEQSDRPYRPPSTQTQSPYQSPNEQSDRPYRPPSTQTQSPYQSPNEQLDRSYRSPSAQTQSSYQSPNEQLDRSYRSPSAQTQSSYQSPNEQLDRPYRPPSTQTQSPYQSPNEQLDRSYRSPSAQTQSSYQSPNEQSDRPYRPPSTQTESPYQSPNEQLDRSYRSPSAQTQSSYQSPNEQLDRTLRSPATQTELSQSILIELPSQPPEQPLQQSSASNTIIVNNADEIVGYLDQQNRDNLLSLPIVSESDFNAINNFLIFKPRTGN